MICHVCPWWIGYLLASPIRRWLQDPVEILSPYLEPGMTVLEVGPGMGFFSIPLAEILGPEGRLICVDVQERMLQSLRKRVEKADLTKRVETRLCTATNLGVDDLIGEFDFALAFAVVHEIPDRARLFAQLAAALKPGGKLLVAEPKGHVTAVALEQTIALAETAGFEVSGRPTISRSRSVTLGKSGRGPR